MHWQLKFFVHRRLKRDLDDDIQYSLEANDRRANNPPKSQWSPMSMLWNTDRLVLQFPPPFKFENVASFLVFLNIFNCK